MPELLFDLRWPDGSVTTCYSPSTIVGDVLHSGRAYTVDELVRRTRLAMRAAGERVRLRYGATCPRAAATLADIEARARGFEPQALVRLERYHGQG